MSKENYTLKKLITDNDEFLLLISTYRNFYILVNYMQFKYPYLPHVREEHHRNQRQLKVSIP